MSNKHVVTTPAVTTEINEDTMALSLSQQYEDIGRATGELVRRVLNFGCAIYQAEQELDRRGLLKNRKAGQGMQGWLADKCPTINYKTAQRWKAIAINASNQLGCSSADAIAILTGSVAPTSATMKSRCDKIFAADSLRHLSQLLFDFAADSAGSNAGRPVGTGSTGTSSLTRTESARRLWARLIAGIRPNRQAFYKAAKLLPIDEARASLEEVKMLVAALTERCKEGN